MEKFLENLVEAEKELRTLDHMVYITFPLIKDKRILLKVIQEVKEVITKCITAVLQYEYMYKRINLYKDSKANLRTFMEKCTPRYGITKAETMVIGELFDIVDRHKESPMEFMKGEKVVILSENSSMATLSLDKVKEFLILAKEMLRKVREKIGENFTS